MNLLVQKGNPNIKQVMENLLQGKSFEAKIDEKIVFDQLNGSANAHSQIEEKLYEAKLIADGFSPEQIRKYGFVFKGKECLIG